MKDAVIKVESLKKHFRDVRAVDGVTFEIRGGEVFGLLGPNGAGKTTTIKLLLGLLEKTSGEIKVFGMDPEDDEVAIKRRIGYVSEEPMIFKSLNPQELFSFIASVRELDEEEVTSRARDLIESFGFVEYADKLIATLSRGNKQKAQVIAALLHEPELLILDEPLAGLDAKSVRVVKEIIEMHCERGGAVLFSTHIMEVAQDICDRIGIINQGKLVAVGTLSELQALVQGTGADLESIFLRLTEQDASVAEIVEHLRGKFHQVHGH